jgi:hypothetical protein
MLFAWPCKGKLGQGLQRLAVEARQWTLFVLSIDMGTCSPKFYARNWQEPHHAVTILSAVLPIVRGTLLVPVLL